MKDFELTIIHILVVVLEEVIDTTSKTHDCSPVLVVPIYYLTNFTLLRSDRLRCHFVVVFSPHVAILVSGW